MYFQQETETLERSAIYLLDSVLERRGGTAEISSFTSFIVASHVSLQKFIGCDVEAIVQFVENRNFLWKMRDKNIVQKQPMEYRAAVVGLLEEILSNKNRLPLADVFSYFRCNHPQMLPYLRAPTFGSNVEAAKTFVDDHPMLLRFVDKSDGQEWTRCRTLADVVIESQVMVSNHIVLINVKPTIVPVNDDLSKKPMEEEVNGIGSIVEITNAFGVLHANEVGNIYFSSAAMGGGDMLQKGLRVGQSVGFVAKCAKSGNVNRWKALRVHFLNSSPRIPTRVQQDLQSVPLPVQSAPLPDPFSKTEQVKPQVKRVPPNDHCDLRKPGMSMMDWIRKRQAQSACAAAEIQQLQQQQCDAERWSPLVLDSPSISTAPNLIDNDIVVTDNEMTSARCSSPSSESSYKSFRATPDTLERVDVGVQTDFSYEQQLVELLRQAPYLLDWMCTTKPVKSGE